MLKVGPVEVLEQVELGPMTTLGVGGRAQYFVDASDEPTLLGALEWAAKRRLSVRLLGDGSNVVVADEGCDGLVVRNRVAGVDVKPNGAEINVRVSSGETWDDFVALTVERGWAGVECMSGIPGRVGATPIQNVGAYGQDVAQRIRSVSAVDRVTGRRVELFPPTCRFAYRDSLFKSREPGRYVVLGVTFGLTPGGEPTVAYPELSEAMASRLGQPVSLADVRAAVLDLRRRKSMLLDPKDENSRSCGSFFLNPVVDAATVEQVERRLGEQDLPRYPQPDGRTKLSAVWLLEKAGFSRGMREGSVGLSTNHSLALVCHQGATASALVGLARRIRDRVIDTSGVSLSPEPAFWGFAEVEGGLPTS